MTKHFSDDFDYGPNPIKSIFLIEKGWIDPMENHDADGYEPFAFTESEEKASKFCMNLGFWTTEDCWSIQYKPGGIMPKYKYKEIPPLK